MKHSLKDGLPLSFRTIVTRMVCCSLSRSLEKWLCMLAVPASGPGRTFWLFWLPALDRSLQHLERLISLEDMVHIVLHNPVEKEDPQSGTCSNLYKPNVTSSDDFLWGRPEPQLWKIVKKSMSNLKEERSSGHVVFTLPSCLCYWQLHGARGAHCHVWNFCILRSDVLLSLTELSSRTCELHVPNMRNFDDTSTTKESESSMILQERMNRHSFAAEICRESTSPRCCCRSF